MTNLGPNVGLIDQPGSRTKLQTPALVIDLDVLERNIECMADFARKNGIALRPHAKTHKSVEIARRQVKAGAVGVCTATIGEAEVMVEAGIPGVLITNPAVGAGKIARVMALCAKADDLMVVVDNVCHVEALDAAAAKADQTVRVVVAIDVGTMRIGARTPEAAFEAAQKIEASERLIFTGIHAYTGTYQHIESYDERRDAVAEQNTQVVRFKELLDEAGMEPLMVTGTGTGTYDIDTNFGLYTEAQVGSYIFTDVEYNAVDLVADNPRPFDPSLFVQTTVVSNSHDGAIITDGGVKRFAMGGAAPQIISGAPENTVYEFKGDEHGQLLLEDAAGSLPIGTTVVCITPHCDPTVNLYDYYHVVRGDTLVDIWPVDARGAI